jgi:hypothetical protein
MARIAYTVKVIALAAAAALPVSAVEVSYNGVVKDKAGEPIEGSRVRLVDSGISDVTDASGRYKISGTLDAAERPVRAVTSRLKLHGGNVVFRVDRRARVVVGLFDTRGRQVAALVDALLDRGEHRVRVPFVAAGSQVYLVRMSQDSRTLAVQVVSLVDGRAGRTAPCPHSTPSAPRPVRKAAAGGATAYLVATHPDYNGASAEAADAQDTIDFVLGARLCDTSIAMDPGEWSYAVRFPNGGEVFYTGEKCTIEVSAAIGANASIRIFVGPGGIKSFTPDELESSFDPHADSLLTVNIPRYYGEKRWVDSLEAFVTDSISPVSDSCLLQLFDYDNEGYGDFSDCFFAIRAR